MSEAPLMLGVSGLRGIVGESLTPEVAVRYAAAFGTWLQRVYTSYQFAGSEGGPIVMVARDGRAGGEQTYEAVIDGLLRTGCSVYAAGVQMTPTVGCAIECGLHMRHGVVVTASHNPQEWNGIKLLVDGAAPPVDIANIIITEYQGLAVIGSQAGQLSEYDNAELLHIEEVGDRLGLALNHYGEDPSRQRPLTIRSNNPYHVVVDSVNTSGRVIVPGFFADLANVELHHLFADESGIFPHTPEPTAENLSGEGGLCDAVPGLKADIGFAQDPDGDRLAIVDEKGRYIGEEYTLVLAAMSILEARKSRGREHAGGAEEDGALTPALSRGAREREEEKTPHPGPLPEGEREEETLLCVNLSTSRMIDDVAAKYGARVVRTAVGEANVVEAMKKLKREGKDVILGGEGNGGVIWPEVTYVRDSLGAMALTLSLMARTGKTVSELVADVPSYAIVKRKQPLAKKDDARPTIEKLTAHYSAMGDGVRVDTQDGVRIDFEADRAWVHVRASNTEPILRLIGEAPTRDRAEAVLDEVQRLV